MKIFGIILTIIFGLLAFAMAILNLGHWVMFGEFYPSVDTQIIAIVLCSSIAYLSYGLMVRQRR